MGPKRQSAVIPIRRSTSLSWTDEVVADFAYTLWLSSAFQGGLPEDAFLTALRLVKGPSSVGPFLVPKRRHDLHPATKSKDIAG